jgi:hypothetical protein
MVEAIYVHQPRSRGLVSSILGKKVAQHSGLQEPDAVQMMGSDVLDRLWLRLEVDEHYARSYLQSFGEAADYTHRAVGLLSSAELCKDIARDASLAVYGREWEGKTPPEWTVTGVMAYASRAPLEDGDEDVNARE